MHHFIIEMKKLNIINYHYNFILLELFRLKNFHDLSNFNDKLMNNYPLELLFKNYNKKFLSQNEILIRSKPIDIFFFAFEGKNKIKEIINLYNMKLKFISPAAKYKSVR